jgi:hypothetical protein
LWEKLIQNAGRGHLNSDSAINWWIRKFVALGRSKFNAIKDETSRGTATTIPTTDFTFYVAAG